MRTSHLLIDESRTFAEPRPSVFPGQAANGSVLDHALGQWITTEPRARLLVDDALRICWISPAAEVLISGPGSLLVRNGHLRTRENRFERQLRELIGRATPQLSTASLHDPKRGEQLVITAVRLDRPYEEMVGLTLLRATDDFQFRLADLHSAFGLTQTEARVAYHLLCGRTAEETAQELGVALETVRTHIKRAYGKLGVSSREAFFHRLTPFVILLT